MNVTYSSYFNWRHKRFGHLFQGRYRSKPVDKDTCMIQASVYIHLNAYRAGLEDRLGSYTFSSLKDYTRTHKNTDITVSTILGLLSAERGQAVIAYRKLIQSEKRTDTSSSGFDETIAGSKEFVQRIMSALKKKDTGNNIPLINLIRTRLTPEDIVKIVCEETGVSRDTLNHRERNNRRARNISIYMIKTYTSLTNKENGELFGISYSGVTQCCFRLSKQKERDEDLSSLLETISSKVECQLW